MDTITVSVNPVESLKLQKYLFSNGYTNGGIISEPQHTPANYLMISNKHKQIIYLYYLPHEHSISVINYKDFNVKQLVDTL